MVMHGARLLLILASRDAQSAAQLTAAATESPFETLRELRRLVEWGFVIVADEVGVAVYRLTPKGVRADDPNRRILLVEDDLVLRELVVTILEDEGYAVIASRAPVEAAELLDHISFDLVITDGFSRTGAAVFTSTADLLRAAGSTPVALFSAHTLKTDTALAAGFRDLITKPVDLETLERQVGALLFGEELPVQEEPPA
jgi:CheY-like chemotaxis protein